MRVLKFRGGKLMTASIGGEFPVSDICDKCRCRFWSDCCRFSAGGGQGGSLFIDVIELDRLLQAVFTGSVVLAFSDAIAMFDELLVAVGWVAELVLLAVWF